MIRISSLTAALLAASALVAMTPAAHAAANPQLKAVYASILKDPDNVELNLRYAKLAEEAGEPRKALSTYERILLSYPNNAEAKTGLARIRRHLQPDATSFLTEFGVAFESNPLRVSSGADSEFQAFGKISMVDEHHVGSLLWRTNAVVDGTYHFEQNDNDGGHHDLTYAHIGAETGPLIDLPGTSLTLRPAIGGAAATLAHTLYFTEGTASVGLEGNFNGAYQVTRARVGYRDYGSTFASDAGIYVDVTGKYTFPDAFGTGGVLVASPWVRWSDIPGTYFDADFNEFAPGQYTEGGGRLEYYHSVGKKVVVGVNVAANYRAFAFDPDGSGGLRRDVLVSPGATVIFKNVFALRNDIRIDYNYLCNNSNFWDGSKDYNDHVVKLTFVNRL